MIDTGKVSADVIDRFNNNYETTNEKIEECDKLFEECETEASNDRQERLVERFQETYEPIHKEYLDLKPHLDHIAQDERLAKILE